MLKSFGSAIAAALMSAPFILWIAGIIGWIWNIVKLVGMVYDPTITPMLIIRAVGIFLAPLGAVVGYF